MNVPRKYATPDAFKVALESRLRGSDGDGLQLVRRRQLIVFDRYMARVVTVFGDAVVLKGGLVLELRLRRARTTKDIDLSLRGDADTVLRRLQEAGRLDLGDMMNFEVGPDPEHPVIDNDGMQYEGQRFRASCKLGGRLFGNPFGVDVAFGDPMLRDPDVHTVDDVLAFAGIAPPTVRMYPAETHIAEKLHAYTMPRKRPNTRVKDLPDLALLAMTGAFAAGEVRRALALTFDFRKTHSVPSSLPTPPETWAAPYAELARENALRWATLVEVTGAARAFLDPVLDGVNARWNPEGWRWED